MVNLLRPSADELYSKQALSKPVVALREFVNMLCIAAIEMDLEIFGMECIQVEDINHVVKILVFIDVSEGCGLRNRVVDQHSDAKRNETRGDQISLVLCGGDTVATLIHSNHFLGVVVLDFCKPLLIVVGGLAVLEVCQQHIGKGTACLPCEGRGEQRMLVTRNRLIPVQVQKEIFASRVSNSSRETVRRVQIGVWTARNANFDTGRSFHAEYLVEDRSCTFKEYDDFDVRHSRIDVIEDH
jgi:hypothetical protein